MTKAAPNDGKAPTPTEQMSLEGDDALRLYCGALARNLEAIDDQLVDLSEALREWTIVLSATDDAGEAS